MGKQPAKHQAPRTPKPLPISTETGAPARERIAKRLARAGLCSRREAEAWIAAGRVSVNGKLLDTPAFTVGPSDHIEVDGAPLPQAERTRLWLFHKPAGLVTTARDPEGRPTVFSALPKDMPRVMSIGRLDINTEGLLLLTNDGGLARLLELPQTGWLRRYRVRAHGEVSQEQLDALKDGIAVEGVLYGSMEATLDRKQGANVWITLALREGKNREVKKVLGALGLTVNRLIRLSFGPFQLGDLAEREVREIRGRMLRDQLGPRLIEAAGANFDAPLLQRAEEPKPGPKRVERGRPGQKAGVQKPVHKLARGQAGEESLDRLETRKGARGAGHKPGPGMPRGAGKPKPFAKPAGGKPFGKPSSERMRGDAKPQAESGHEVKPGDKRTRPQGARPPQKFGGRTGPGGSGSDGPGSGRPGSGGPDRRGRGNADRRR